MCANSDKHSFQLVIVSDKLVIGMTKGFFFVGLQGDTEGPDDCKVASSTQKLQQINDYFVSVKCNNKLLSL